MLQVAGLAFADVDAKGVRSLEIKVRVRIRHKTQTIGAPPAEGVLSIVLGEASFSQPPRVILVDVDGTVALRGNRSPYDETLVQEDLPNVPVIEVVRALSDAGFRLIFVSGRTQGSFMSTTHWILNNVNRPIERLLMRKLGDGRQDALVKREIYETLVRDHYEVLCVIDDRQQVVDEWRALGLTCLQVAPGDF